MNQLKPSSEKNTCWMTESEIKTFLLIGDKIWKKPERNVIDKQWLKTSSKNNKTYKYNWANKRQKMALCCCGFYTEWKPCSDITLIVR